MIKQVKRALRYRALLRKGDLSIYVSDAFTEGDKAASQRLHGLIYFKFGYLTAADLTSDGRLNYVEDPYQDHSRYFAVRTRSDDRVVATARVIEHSEAKGHASFQTIEHQIIDDKYRTYLMSLDPKRCAEVSGLVKQADISSYATMLLYRAMWLYSLAQGQIIWVMSCDENLFRRLQMLFGDSLVRIGPTKFYKGHDVVPAMLHLTESLDILIRSTRDINIVRRSLKLDLLRFFLTGVEVKLLTADQKRVLKRLRLDESA